VGEEEGRDHVTKVVVALLAFVIVGGYHGNQQATFVVLLKLLSFLLPMGFECG